MQRRTGLAIAFWSLLPFAVACERLSSADLSGCAAFFALAGISLTAAGLVRLPHRASQVIAAVLLFLMSGPFVVRVSSLLVAGYGPGALRIADSPLGYVIGVVTNSLFAVPLAVFAVSVWRRRPAQSTTAMRR